MRVSPTQRDVRMAFEESFADPCRVDANTHVAGRTTA